MANLEISERSDWQARSVLTNNLEPSTRLRLAPTTSALARADERRRLARDLHDGVQNELFSLMLRLKIAEAGSHHTLRARRHLRRPRRPRRGRARIAARNRPRIYPLPLAKLGLTEALRAQAARVPISVNIAGTTPRSTHEAEAAIYLCCSEAIQNVVKHAGPSARVKLGLHSNHGVLAVRIEDDGRGFDLAQTPDGAGLRNIRERAQTLDGTFTILPYPDTAPS